MINILFYFPSEICSSLGGVERVVSLQYYELTQRGYVVFTLYGKMNHDEDSIPNQYRLPVSDCLSAKENIIYIEHFIKEKSIRIAFNFAAVFNKSSICVVEACKKVGVPIISVLHNTLEFPLWNIPVVKHMMKYTYARRLFVRLWGVIQRLPFYKGGRYIYKNAAATVVLAPCYLDEYKKMIYRKATNVYHICNPLPIPVEKVDRKKKQNIALFVGRLEKQKSVDKLIRAWAKLNMKTWKLYIIGSGSQEKYLKRLAQELGIEGEIIFESHQSPIPYYRRAKLFCLTSIYEGYPMTLIECQAYGVVPIIYNSFPAAYEIVKTGYNGMLIPAFKEDEYVQGLKQLMNSDKQLDQMSRECYKEVDKYLVDRIMEQWIELINRFLK